MTLPGLSGLVPYAGPTQEAAPRERFNVNVASCANLSVLYKNLARNVDHSNLSYV